MAAFAPPKHKQGFGKQREKRKKKTALSNIKDLLLHDVSFVGCPSFSKNFTNFSFMFYFIYIFLCGSLFNLLQATDSRRDAKIHLLIWPKLCQHITRRNNMQGLLWISMLGSIICICRYIPVLVQSCKSRHLITKFSMHLEHI